jgi:hypothetical protein
MQHAQTLHAPPTRFLSPRAPVSDHNKQILLASAITKCINPRPFATQPSLYYRPNPALSPTPTNTTAVTTTPTSQSENGNPPRRTDLRSSIQPRPQPHPKPCTKQSPPQQRPRPDIHDWLPKRKPAERGRQTQSPHCHGWVWCVGSVRGRPQTLNQRPQAYPRLRS